MTEAKKARAIGFNHVALEVGDIEEALAFYRKLFSFELRSKSADDAFIDLGDQFIQLTLGRTQVADTKRHFGFVVDDRDAVRRAMDKLGIKSINDRLNILDPWGNRIEIVPYDDVQFTKAENIFKGMGIEPIQKSSNAIAELTKKGMARGT